jgi:hypothetical protein|tara:strand:+ start:121 stop:480 length:360 start_codon:yes stop_codon:yes gene_type:complete
LAAAAAEAMADQLVALVLAVVLGELVPVAQVAQVEVTLLPQAVVVVVVLLVVVVTMMGKVVRLTAASQYQVGLEVMEALLEQQVPLVVVVAVAVPMDRSVVAVVIAAVALVIGPTDILS